MSTQYPPFFTPRDRPHPIDDEHIELAIENASGDASFEDVYDILSGLQENVEDSVQGELEFIESNYGEAPEYGMGYITTYNFILFTCWSPNFGDAVSKMLDIDERENKDAIRAAAEAHIHLFDALVDERDLTLDASTTKPQAEYGSLVIEKPNAFIAGEDAVTRTITHLVDAGATPAQVLDFLMTTRGPQGIGLDAEDIKDASRVSDWADRRGRSTQAIYQNVRGASDAVEEYNSKKVQEAQENDSF